MKAIKASFLDEVSRSFAFLRFERGGEEVDENEKRKANLVVLSVPTRREQTQARAGLAGKPSSLMMLPSMVDVLPSG